MVGSRGTAGFLSLEWSRFREGGGLGRKSPSRAQRHSPVGAWGPGPRRQISHILQCTRRCSHFPFVCCIIKENELVHFDIIYLSFCKFSPDSYTECMKCVCPMTQTSLSPNHRHTHPASAFLTRFARISLVASGPARGSGPMDPRLGGPDLWTPG